MSTEQQQSSEKAEATCPIPGCGADLYLTITSNVPIYRIEPPWPGAGPTDYSPAGAVSCGWDVVCVDGHTVWTHVDQIAADNAAGLTEDDLTGDYAPEFRLDAMPLPPGQNHAAG